MERVKYNFVGVIMAVSFIISLGVPALAQEYPNKPVTLVIPYAAGGPTDLSTRALAKAAENFLGQPIICDNKPGGGSTIGPTLVLEKPADGYTLGILTSGVINNYQMGTVNFNPIEDPTHIMRLAAYNAGLVVRADSPWKTIQDLVAYAKQNPKKLSHAFAGLGSTGHLTVEYLASVTGIEVLQIPYKSDAEATTAVLGGHADFMFGSGWFSLVDAGKLRVLASDGEKRIKKYPQVPTLKEAYNVVTMAFMGLMGPKGLPKPIVQKNHDAFRKALDDHTFQTFMENYGMQIVYLNTEDYEKFLKQEDERVRKIVQKAGLYKK